MWGKKKRLVPKQSTYQTIIQGFIYVIQAKFVLLSSKLQNHLFRFHVMTDCSNPFYLAHIIVRMFETA